METVEDIVKETREHHILTTAPCACWVMRKEELIELCERIEAAHIHEVTHLLKIDNACVAQCAALLDDHIKAVVAEVKRRCAHGDR